MIDAAAEALARRILVVFPASTARTRADVQRIQVPVGRLLDAMLDRHADRLATLPDSAWLDRRHPDLPAAAAVWRDAVRAAAQVPADAWEEAVAQAARLALSHLVRPAETAAADAFADGPDRLPVPAALGRVRVFGAYGYLPEIAARYAERKGIADLDRPGLERLLRRIDRRMVEDFGADEWIALTGPLYDLLGPVATPQGAIGTGLLRALFEAKGRHEIASTLVADGYTREALHARLADVLPRSEPDAPPPAAPPPAAPPPAPPPDDARGVTGEAPTHIEDAALAEPAVSEPAVSEPAVSEPADAAPPLTTQAVETPVGAAPVDAEDEPSTTPDAEPQAPPTTAPPDSAPPAASPEALARPAEMPESAEPEPDVLDALADAPTIADAAPVSDGAAPVPAAPGSAAPQAPAPDDAEPLWKRMLRPAGATALPVGSPAADEAAPAAAVQESGPPDPGAPPANDEPLWRRFAALEAAVAPDDADGWDVEPTLAAVSGTPQEPLAEPSVEALPAPRTLAESFRAAGPEPALPPAETLAAPPVDAPPPDTTAPDAAAPGADPAAPDRGDTPPDALVVAHAAAPLDALELTVLGSGAMERREWFVGALFGGSRDDYAATLRRLADAPDWTSATQIIASDVFRKHRVNIYSEASIAFTDAVEARLDAR